VKSHHICFTDMLACAPDASKEIIRQKYDRIVSTANLVNDKEIREILRCLCKQICTTFNRTGGNVMKLNTPIDLKYSIRYYQFSRQYAIRDVTMHWSNLPPIAMTVITVIY